MANVKITTGQYVTIEQKVASVSDRVYAQMLDAGFMWVYLFVASIGLLVIETGFEDNRTLNSILLFAIFLPIIFYHPFFEYFFKGASPGKKILKMKVLIL